MTVRELAPMGGERCPQPLLRLRVTAGPAKQHPEISAADRDILARVTCHPPPDLQCLTEQRLCLWYFPASLSTAPRLLMAESVY